MNQIYWIAKLGKGYWSESSSGYVEPMMATKLRIHHTKEQAEKWFGERIQEHFRVVQIEVKYNIKEY